MDNSALAGYAIGSWLKTYIDRGQMRTQRERLLAGQANTNSTQSTNMPDVANTPGYGQATADTLSFGPLSKLAEVTQQSAAQQPTAQPDVSSMQGYGQATPQTLSLGGGTSAGQNMADSATQAGAQQTIPGILGSASAMADKIAQSAKEQPQPTDITSYIQAQQQAQNNSMNQQAIAEQEAKQKALINLGITAATGGFGGGSSAAGGAGAGTAGASLTLGNAAAPSSFFGQAAHGDNTNGAAGQDLVSQALQHAGYTPLGQDGRMMATQLIGYKRNYDNAAANGDAQGMKDARDSAEIIRNRAAQLGINLDEYGAGKTYNQAVTSSQADYDAGYSRLLKDNDMTSDEYYQQVFNRVKQNGGTDTQAAQLAREQAMVYQAQRLARFRNGFYNYGISPDGSISNIGAQILDSMYQEKPTSIALADKYYAKPADDYTYKKKVDYANVVDAIKRGDMRLNKDLTIDLNNNTFTNNAKLKNMDYAHQVEMANISYTQKQSLMAAQAAAQNMVGQQKYDFIYQKVKEAGGSDMDAARLALSGMGVNGEKGSTEKLTTGQKDTINQLENLLLSADSSVNDNSASADDGSAISDAQNTLEELRKKGKIDNDTYSTYYERLQDLIAARQRKHGYQS